MTDKISDNVGKKIVEALKMQNQDNESVSDYSVENSDSYNYDDADVVNDNSYASSESVSAEGANFSTNDGGFFNSESDIDSAFQNSINQNLGIKSSFVPAQVDFELPNNVAILNRLIAKLPVGVSKQTGAMIISQTMEALGISMDSVIKEAKEVQNSLTDSARECQRTIIEYRKQISELELKSQQYQKQAVTMNDVINLFTHS